jgi:hypothetical protein
MDLDLVPGAPESFVKVQLPKCRFVLAVIALEGSDEVSPRVCWHMVEPLLQQLSDRANKD